jgi:uncharacterized protein (AIM24 family)
MVASAADTLLPLALDAFLRDVGERPDAVAPFAAESASCLRIDVRDAVWIRPGAAIAHRGTLTFTRRATLAATSLGDAAAREAAPLVRVTGRGRLHCGVHGAQVRVLQLHGEALTVAWPELLAFETTLDFSVALVGDGLGLAAGGLAVVRLSGHGAVAVVLRGRPVALRVTPGAPVYTDPHATVAWTAGLEPALELDATWRTVIGHEGHHAVRMHFAGSGVVVVQPSQDPRRFAAPLRSLRRVAAMFPA